jgi:hypothetical protein
LKLPTTFDNVPLTFCLAGTYNDGSLERQMEEWRMYPYSYVDRVSFLPSFSQWPHQAGWHAPPHYQAPAYQAASYPKHPYPLPAASHPSPPASQPLVPWTANAGQHGAATGAAYATPYPKPNPVLPPPSGMPSIMAQFKNSDGTYDINKMMNTMGQMIHTVNQVGGMLKGLVGAFKK